MARISKESHPAILRMVDVEGRKVTEVAAQFGCTPANIYALLGKLRRRPGAGRREGGSAQPPLAFDQKQPAGEQPAGTGGTIRESEAAAPPSGHPPGDDAKAVAFEPAAAPSGPDAESPPSGGGTAARARVPAPSSRGGAAAVGARLAKPGFGLMMRTPDGEENLTPFRSLDDLLSAIKPILRASARSPEPVWFSLGPVDLATIDVDAA